jgi:hypothetical protein
MVSINKYYNTINNLKKSRLALILLVIFCFAGSAVLADNPTTTSPVQPQILPYIEVEQPITVVLPNSLVVQGITAVLEPATVDSAVSTTNLITPLARLVIKDKDGNVLNVGDLKQQLKCPTYLTDKIMKSSAEIKKLQKFLQQEEGFANVKVNGSFNSVTVSAVKQFQEEYSEDVLKPFDLKKGTGLVKGMTLKKINSLYCQNVWERDNYPQLVLKYDPQEITGGGMSKEFFYFDEATAKFLPLASFDNVKTGKVIAPAINVINLIIGVFKTESKFSGIASWYKYKGGNFAASRDFPKGTKIKVTNQAEGVNKGKSVIIKVNDYGPEIQTGRLIDLDSVAFQKIGALKSGLIPVTIERVE